MVRYKEIVFSVVISFGAALLSADTSGSNSVINVRDFGAKGDGVSDDTSAVRSAVAEAVRQNDSMLARLGSRCTNVGVGDGPLSAVVFPKGAYRLTDTILIRRSVVLRGEEGAEILMDNAAKDIIYFHNAFRCRVSGLIFSGGAVQLRFWTANNDSANLTVRECGFKGSSRSAVECLSYSYVTNGHKKTLAPYLEVKGSPVVNPQYDGNRRNFPNSTLLTVEECVFDDCRRVLDWRGDGGVMRNCKIVSSAQSQGGLLKVGTRFRAYGIDVTVQRDRRLTQSVFEIENCLLDITRSTFRTTDGSGVCTVRSRAKPGYAPTYINLEDVMVESGFAEDDSPIVLEKGTSPNIIRVAGLVEKGILHASPIYYIGGYDEKALAEARYFKSIPVERTYSTEIIGVSPVRPSPPSAPKRGGHETVLLAEDFGVDTDIRTDDTEALKRLFAVAAGAQNVKIVFPGTWINLSETVDVPANVILTSAGTAGFRIDSEAKDIFRVPAFTDVRFSNLMFAGGRHSIVMNARRRGIGERLLGGGKAYVSFTDCFFYDAASYAVVAISGDGTEDRRNDFDIVMDGGVAFTAKVYQGNGSAWDDRRWVEILPEANGHLSGAVAWENRGSLIMRDMLGVPMSVCGMVTMDKVPVFKEVPTGDFRWVDNHGDFISLYSRYGGEFGGQTPVYNYGSGSVLMEGGFAWFENRMAHQYPVLADRPDARLRLSCMGFSPNLRGNPIRFAWRDPDGIVRPTNEQKISLYAPMNVKTEKSRSKQK